MNIQGLKTLLIEEMRSLAEGNQCCAERLSRFPLSVLLPEVRAAVDRFLSDGREQNSHLMGIFARMQIPSEGGRNEAAHGLLAEVDQLESRTGANEPASIDPRMIAILRKLIHHRLACLRSMLVTAHVLDATGTQDALLTCLKMDLEEERRLGEMAVDVLRLTCAETATEAAETFESLVRKR